MYEKYAEKKWGCFDKPNTPVYCARRTIATDITGNQYECTVRYPSLEPGDNAIHITDFFEMQRMALEYSKVVLQSIMLQQIVKEAILSHYHHDRDSNGYGLLI